jgi:adenosine kinase
MRIPVVITGSLAYDHVMTFPDRFGDHILPEKIHALNVAFNIDSLERHFGGTAGNIAYNMALLKDSPVIVATAGEDFSEYADRLKKLGLSTEGIRILRDEKTAQAFIMTDLSDNQITGFHGGAMFRAHENPLEKALKLIFQNTNPVPWAIISPNGVEAMKDHARECQKQKIPFLFDPGQAMNALTGDDMVKAVHGSRALTVNDYEWEWWQKKTSLSPLATLELTEAVVITKGSEGLELLTRESREYLPAVQGIQPVDPTGCGDALRAGLLWGLSRGHTLKQSAMTGTVLASFCVEKAGTQNHTITEREFTKRMVALKRGSGSVPGAQDESEDKGGKGKDHDGPEFSARANE